MLIKILLIVSVSYLIIFVLAITASKFLIFFPPAPGYSDGDLPIIKLALPNGLKISALYLFNPKAKYTLLYSHGNAEDLGLVRHRLLEYQNAGFSVFSYDYPGYGTSQGRPSEHNVYQSIFAAYNYLTEDLSIPASNIIAYGFSVGCGPSLELAIHKPLAALILQSPFLSAFRVVTRYKIFPYDLFDNYKKIVHINTPLLIYHGASDEIISFYHSQTLWNKALEPKTYIEVPNADHNNFIHFAGQVYWDELHKFVNSL